MRDKQTQIEREEIAEIIAQNHNLNGEKWDASDYEWAAHCVQMAGYRKASEVIEEVFLALDKRTEDEGLVYIKKGSIVNAIKKKKVEIAREIFEEIEDVINNIGYFDEIDFRSLKKKYLGEDINDTTKESEKDNGN